MCVRDFTNNVVVENGASTDVRELISGRIDPVVEVVVAKTTEVILADTV